MIDQHTIDQVVRLLDDGRTSQREIARRLRISRALISDIANGRRGRYGRPHAAALTELPQVVRCPACGVRVELPCVACRAREWQHRVQLRRPGQVRCLPIRVVAGQCHPGPARVA